MMWHGGQGGPTAEQVKLARSRDARGRRTPFEGVVSLADEIRNVAAFIVL